MRYMMIAAATVALVGAATLASAQAPDDKGKDPPAEGKGSAQDGKGMQRERGRDQPKATEQPEKARPKATEQPGRDRPKATEQPDRDRPKATERPDRDRPKATERPDKDRPKATEQPDRDRPKATERPDRDRPKATERPDKDRPKATERPDKDRPKATEQQPGTKDGARVRVSDQDRRTVRERLTRTKVEKTRINVSVNIGSPIPRTVRLRPLPAAIFTVAPVYRGHSYIVLEDETIVIVDARTYVIIDVIPAGTQRVALALSADQMHFIYTRVPKDRTADVRVRLALGAEVPRNVELLPFPGEVVARIPEVGRYRFVVAADDVVIVDPSDHSVVLVINE